MGESLSSRLLCTGLLLLLFTGCGERQVYPVRGQIVDRQGKPVTGLKDSTVQFENLENKSSAHGVIDDKGEFRLSTNTPGDGARPGKHRVAILPVDRGPDIKISKVIDPRYESFETSGLTETVEKKDNVLKIQVDLYKK